MILYHFTAISLLASIEREGLTKGEIPYTPTDLGNGVWFTTDPNPAGHGLTDGGPIPEAEHAYLEREAGKKLPPLTRPDKRRIRIRVVISSRDPRLKEWLRFARRHLEKNWMDILTQTGGGKRKAETWWIYLGTIPARDFKEIEVRGPDGIYRPITDEDRQEAQAQAIQASQTYTTAASTLT